MLNSLVPATLLYTFFWPSSSKLAKRVFIPGDITSLYRPSEWMTWKRLTKIRCTIRHNYSFSIWARGGRNVSMHSNLGSPLINSARRSYLSLRRVTWSGTARATWLPPISCSFRLTRDQLYCPFWFFFVPRKTNKRREQRSIHCIAS